MTTDDNLAAGRALAEIAASIEGEVRTDALSRAIYATDASIYEIVPDGVVLPKHADDVGTCVRICAKHHVPITARGAGTGLTGGAVNRGVQIDLSHHMNRIVAIDPQAQTVRVQPGVVLDELNAALAHHNLHFAADVATSSRATIGGMIANNSCGAHSVSIGRTVNHMLALDVVLSDGSRATWGENADTADTPVAQAGEAAINAVVRELHDEIETRYPKVLRRNGGYALDRVRTDDRVNVETILCGSEGTLAIIVEATLKLTPLPKHKGMIVAHFDDMLASLAATPQALTHKPAAVELVDKFILDATKANPAMARRRSFLKGDPAAILVCELYDEDESDLLMRLHALADDLQQNGHGYAHPVIMDAAEQADVWEVRKGGLGLLMSIPGDRQPYAFVEDTAVDPARLRDYIECFSRILHEEGVDQAGYYAHASVGCLHVRPVLNLRLSSDVTRMHRIADRISSLALEFGGTMTGEHGDGIVRSEWLEKMYGPKIIAAFKRIKQTFDPDNILNPGKIVDPLPMTSNLRYGEGFSSAELPTELDFSKHGGMAGLANMCSGVGQCRQKLVGTMCPSYRATRDEKHSTRARANALRIALSNRSLLDGLSDPSLGEVLDLCLSCKACKTECPTGTDVAKLKAEWLANRIRREGADARTRFIASSIDLAKWGSRFAPLSNWVIRSKPARAILERRYGLDRRIPPPAFSRQTFRKWFSKHRADGGERNPDGQEVVYFVDTWTNHYTPQVGIAAVKLLEAAGCHVLVVDHGCCGRPLMSKGLLSEARLLAERNVESLASLAARGVPIVGTESSCVSAMVDEWPQLVRNKGASRIAEQSMTLTAWLAELLRRTPDALSFDTQRLGSLLYHGHCHEKAIFGTQDAMSLLRACTGGRASEINSGCCGMAGAFGHEVEHYDVATACGEDRLFPAVRERGGASIAVSGFSCREQISHHTDAAPRHVLEYLADALMQKAR